MGLKLFALAFLISSAAAQRLTVCLSTVDSGRCNTLELGDSQVSCLSTANDESRTRIECALRLARGEADLAVFSEEELLVLAQQQPNLHRVVASIRDVSRQEPFAFEAVAVVPVSHNSSFEGLRGGAYCHPGLDVSDYRWSPRVLKTLEQLSARTDRCDNLEINSKSADELEVETLSSFFGSACRPGRWSANATEDAALKSRYPNLCSLCNNNNNCDGYNLDMGVTVAGADNNNRHIQALECLRRSTSNGTAVAYVAWQHVREFFNFRNPELATSYAVLCSNGTLQPLTSEVLAQSSSPCAIVRQPWRSIVASQASAAAVQTGVQSWWPSGRAPSSGWQANLFSLMIGSSSNLVFVEDELVTPANYTARIRTIPAASATSSCIPPRRWCTISTAEFNKCSWTASAAHVLGVQPPIHCHQRPTVFDCLTDIKDDRSDFLVARANYGYLARQHFKLSPVKFVQNSRTHARSFSRVAALVKASATEITRFENLRGRKACFPEYGGIAYVAFLRTAHEVSVVSQSQCDYAQAAGEFFDDACAPGAEDVMHSLSSSSDFNATTLCTACRTRVPTSINNNNYTCAWDYSNLYFGNNGSLACLADSSNDVAFLQLQNINAHFTSLGLNASDYRVLCRNNTLASYAGVNVDNNCLLALVVDSEVLSRRNDPLDRSLNVLLDTLEDLFGYSVSGNQLVNFELFSPFDRVSDLLFKDTVVGLTEPSNTASNEEGRNYAELFSHLDACTGAATGLAAKLSAVTLTVLALVTLVLG